MANQSEEHRPDSPEMSANTFGKLRAYLGHRKYSQQWIRNAIGTGAGGRSRMDIVEALREALA